jgi:(heptosyl)LPS beta-1,4-glucosyltransferase
VCYGKNRIEKYMPQLSAYIMAQNEEGRIRNTLESIKDVVDEIVVIDGGSTDRTVDICKEYTDKVYTHPFEGYAKQRKYALTKVSGDWVLAIDADETLSKDLHDAIPKLILYSEVNAYEFSRRNYVKPGVWIQYGGLYPDYQRRLFRRACASYGEVVHSGERPQVKGRIEQINLDIIHDQVGNNMQYHWSKLMRFVRAEVKENIKSKWFGYYIAAAFWQFVAVIFIKNVLQHAYKMGILGIRVSLSHALLRFLVNIGLAVKKHHHN